jgi:hypothetical protein
LVGWLLGLLVWLARWLLWFIGLLSPLVDFVCLVDWFRLLVDWLFGWLVGFFSVGCLAC